jgi:hypothetical protein
VPALRRAAYPTASAAATGIYTATGGRQAILAFAIHVPGDATFALLVLRSAAVPAGRYARALERLVRTFHGEPRAR